MYTVGKLHVSAVLRHEVQLNFIVLHAVEFLLEVHLGGSKSQNEHQQQRMPEIQDD